MQPLFQLADTIPSSLHWQALSPITILAVGALITMVLSILRIHTRRPAQIATIATLVIALLAVFGSASIPSAELFRGAIEVSPLTRTAWSILMLSTLGLVVGCSRYLTREQLHISDYYHLVLLALLGACVLSSARDLLALFVSLELLSLPIYTLASFRRNDPRCNEAAIKYFVLGGVGGAVLLFGSSFVYGATGSIRFGEIAAGIPQLAPDMAPLFFMGWLLVLAGLLFKVASVPFQMWKPDIYEGAPTPVTGVMATLVTTSGFFALARWSLLLPSDGIGVIADHVLFGSAVLSMILGSLVVIGQTNLKRLFAYSSIANTGTMMLAIFAARSDPSVIGSLWVYLAAYAIANVGAFVLLSMSQTEADQGVELVDLAGLWVKRPWFVFFWSVILLSMAGFPFTFGFWGKWLVLKAFALQAGLGWLLVALACSVASAYAYLRPIAIMTMRSPDESSSQWKWSLAGFVASVVAVTATLGLGIYPKHVVELLKRISL
jgi:NADH-quinone oxidoreductase subunit N